MLVGDGHEDVTANARLEVFSCDSGVALTQRGLEHFKRCAKDILNGDGQHVYAEVVGEFLCVGAAAFGGVAGGHGDGKDVFGSQRINGDGRGERRVDAA